MKLLVYQKLGHLGHFWPFSGHFCDFFKFWENGHFLYALDFLGGPGTINQQKIEICLSFFTGLLEPSKTIYLLKISSFQAFLVILWDFYKFWKISDFWGFWPGREHFESSTTHILTKNQNFQKRLNRALDNHIGYLYIYTIWALLEHCTWSLYTFSKYTNFQLLGHFWQFWLRTWNFQRFADQKLVKNQNFQNLLNRVLDHHNN